MKKYSILFFSLFCFSVSYGMQQLNIQPIVTNALSMQGDRLDRSKFMIDEVSEHFKASKNFENELKKAVGRCVTDFDKEATQVQKDLQSRTSKWKWLFGGNTALGGATSWLAFRQAGNCGSGDETKRLGIFATIGVLFAGTEMFCWKKYRNLAAKSRQSEEDFGKKAAHDYLVDAYVRDKVHNHNNEVLVQKNKVLEEKFNRATEQIAQLVVAVPGICQNLQDHATETREALGDLRTTGNRLGEEVAEVRRNVGQIAVAVEQGAQGMHQLRLELQQGLHAVNESLDAREKRLRNRFDKVEGTVARIDSNTAETREMLGNMHSFWQLQQGSTQRTLLRPSEIQGRFADLENQFKAIEDGSRK